MKIQTLENNGKSIIAEIDEEDNSIDITVVIDGESPVTLNISVDKSNISIRKWIGYGDSEDEIIYLSDLID